MSRAKRAVRSELLIHDNSMIQYNPNPFLYLENP